MFRKRISIQIIARFGWEESRVESLELSRPLVRSEIPSFRPSIPLLHWCTSRSRMVAPNTPDSVSCFRFRSTGWVHSFPERDWCSCTLRLWNSLLAFSSPGDVEPLTYGRIRDHRLGVLLSIPVDSGNPFVRCARAALHSGSSPDEAGIPPSCLSLAVVSSRSMHGRKKSLVFGVLLLIPLDREGPFDRGLRTCFTLRTGERRIDRHQTSSRTSRRVERSSEKEYFQ